MRYNGKAFAQRGIAQLVEQRSPKPRAEGSNPSAPAKAPADLGGSFFVSLKDSNPPAARAAVMPQGAALCGDRGGQMQRGPRSKALRGVPNPSAPAKALTERSELFCFRPPSCLPGVRGGAERMRSGGVVGTVQEKVICNRKPVPTRYPQPLSQGLSALPAPLFDRGRFCGNAIAAPRPTKAALLRGPREFHRFPANELPKIGRRHSPARAVRDLPRAASAAQCRRESLCAATEAV